MEENKDESKEYIAHKIQLGYTYIVLRQEYNENVFYKVEIEQKQFDGQILRGYYPLKFKKDVDIPDGTRIKIKQGIENFYFKKDDPKHYTPVFYMQVNDFEIVDDVIQEYTDAMANTAESELDLPF